MLFRIVIVLFSVVAFINGCNSLISRVAGTHKLRQYSMEQVVQEGIGDADFIVATSAWRSGDFVHTPPLKRGYKPVLAYPILSTSQMDSVEKGMPVHPALIAWTQRFDKNCVNAGNCISKEEFILKGITRKIDKERNRVNTLPKDRYIISENITYLETEREPLAWYWNLVIMLAALALGGGTEWYHSRKTKNTIESTQK
jgi:hypothetical protein